MQWVAMMVGRICQLLSVGIHRPRCGAMWHQCQLHEALLVLQYLAISECFVWKCVFWLFDIAKPTHLSIATWFCVYVVSTIRPTVQTAIERFGVQGS